MHTSVQLIRPKRFGGARGWFTEICSAPTFEKFGIPQTFAQDSHSPSVPAFTVRGLHFQPPPRGKDKLGRCIRERIVGTGRAGFIGSALVRYLIEHSENQELVAASAAQRHGAAA